MLRQVGSPGASLIYVRSAGHHIDFHTGATREGGHPNTGARRSPVGRKVGELNLIHWLVVLLEVREEHPRRQYVLQS